MALKFTTFRADIEAVAKIQKLAQQQGKTHSDVIRESLDSFLASENSIKSQNA